MRRWGLVISLFYAASVLGILVPVAVFLSGASDQTGWNGLVNQVQGVFATGIIWILIVIILGSQILLLFLSVDTSFKKLKPRMHIWVSCAVVGALTALMMFGILLSLGVGIEGEKFVNRLDSPAVTGTVVWLVCGGSWLVWGIAFYVYLRNKSEVVNRIVSWLLKGSVLELLIAVPSHVIVRRREHCCAPVLTSFGITTGIAIMLLSFGPSVLFLYKKRMDAYAVRPGK